MSVPGAVDDPSAIVTEEVTFAGAGGDTLRGLLAAPARPGPHPGVLVIHGAVGLYPHFQDVTRRLANAGYLALAPDLYTREGGVPEDPQAMFEQMFSVPDSRTVGDLEGAADHLRARDDFAGGLGCIGFCAGGRACLLFACSSDRLDAAIDCWGGFVTSADMQHETTEARPTRVIDLVPGLGCPLLAVGGGEDQNPSPEHMAQLRERLEAEGKEFEMEIYPNASHAFFDDSRPSYVPEAAARLWPQMLDFLSR